MNLIELLREKLTPTVEQKVSSFLGEPQDSINTAVHNALPTILGGLIQQGTTDEGAKKVMDIIRDGGHTGDVLNNISNLLDNYDKTQLLVTIGSNIFNHFFGNTASTLVNKVAGLSEIKNSSASSLFGLMSPMVLGAIGYVVHKENLGISGLKKLLDEQREDVSKALPPLIEPHLPLRAINPVNEEVALTDPPLVEGGNVKPRVEKNAVKSNEKSFANSFLPWLFLILALLSAYYMRSCQVSQGDAGIDRITMNDSLLTDNSSGILDDSSTKVEDDTTLFEADNGITTTSEGTILPQAEVAETPPVTPRTVSPQRNSAQAENNSNAPSVPSLSAQRLRNARSWVDISSGSFRSGSAEVKNQSEINVLSTYLQQNPDATISIAPAGSGRVAEDRAYAIREQLYQKGIDISRIIIEPARGSGSGVSLKVNR